MPFMTAPQLYASACGTSTTGPDECHWCGSPCPRLFIHDDPPPLVGERRTNRAVRPGNGYVCIGCWLFRRERITVTMLDGRTQVDCQSPSRWSWWITETLALSPRTEDMPQLIESLIHPPLKFCLALLEGKVANHLHLAIANDHAKIEGGTRLGFTVNNVPYWYNVYELKEALRTGNSSGCEPGVHMLVRLLNPLDREKFLVKREQGRPAEGTYNKPKDVIRMSGVELEMQLSG